MDFTRIRHTHDAFYECFRAARARGLVSLDVQVEILRDAPCVRAVATAGADELLLTLDLDALDAAAVRTLILYAAT